MTRCKCPQQWRLVKLEWRICMGACVHAWMCRHCLACVLLYFSRPRETNAGKARQGSQSQQPNSRKQQQKRVRCALYLSVKRQSCSGAHYVPRLHTHMVGSPEQRAALAAERPARCRTPVRWGRGWARGAHPHLRPLPLRKLLAVQPNVQHLNSLQKAPCPLPACMPALSPAGTAPRLAQPTAPRHARGLSTAPPAYTHAHTLTHTYTPSPWPASTGAS